MIKHYVYDKENGRFVEVKEVNRRDMLVRLKDKVNKLEAEKEHAIHSWNEVLKENTRLEENLKWVRGTRDEYLEANKELKEKLEKTECLTRFWKSECHKQTKVTEEINDEFEQYKKDHPDVINFAKGLKQRFLIGDKEILVSYEPHTTNYTTISNSGDLTYSRDGVHIEMRTR